MSRTIIILTTGVAYLAVPLLCAGGVITHACPYDSNRACSHSVVDSCGPDCDYEHGCRHEGGCSEDPCSIQVVRTPRQISVVITPDAATLASAIYENGTKPTAPSIRAAGHESSAGGNRPYPASDVPLLI